MALISLLDASLAFGDDALLDHADFALEENERVCLVGRNGTGKSTLLKVLAGSLELDSGRMIIKDGLRINRLEQDPPKNAIGDVYGMVARSIPVVGEALARFKESNDIKEQEQLASFIEKHDGWGKEAIIYKILNQVGIEPQLSLQSLSGGWRRKVALACALSNEPQVLLLDEPTNHLDIASITWLEEYLQSFKGTCVFISHDRSFADNLASRIVELDRGKLYSYPGSFDDYVRLRDERLRLEELQRANFDRVLEEEEAWIRRGVKARLARNEGRVRNLEAMRKERAQRRDRQGRVKLNLSQDNRSGNIVFESENIHVAYEGKTIIDDFSPVVMRQDRIGIIGPNGCGKTTLIKVLMGEIKANSGRVKIGSNVNCQYFDQYHEQLDLDKSVADNVFDGKVDVVINGKSIHVLSYLKNFLFTAKRARSLAKVLSGGEKNRLMLARILARPCNVLIMDEPTNDLDLETLELLEEMLQNFPGTVIVISHDRRFIDNFATETWVFEDNGKIESIVGGYSDVISYYKRINKTPFSNSNNKKVKDNSNKTEAKNESQESKKNKLSFTQMHELEALPNQVDMLEKQLAEIDAKIADPNLYTQGADAIKEINEQRVKVQAQLDALYERWEELMAKA